MAHEFQTSMGYIDPVRGGVWVERWVKKEQVKGRGERRGRVKRGEKEKEKQRLEKCKEKSKKLNVGSLMHFSFCNMASCSPG